MGDENNYKLHGQLYGELRPGFNYMAQREMISIKLLTKPKDGHAPIKHVWGFKFEKDGKFECTCRCESDLSSMYDGLGAEKRKLAVLKEIQDLFEIGKGFHDMAAYEKKREELEKKGMLPMAYFTDFEKEKKDDA